MPDVDMREASAIASYETASRFSASISATAASRISVFLLGRINISFFRVASETIGGHCCGDNRHDTNDGKNGQIGVVIRFDCCRTVHGVVDTVINVAG